MVILRRLYSNTGLFKEIVFKKGINIIIGNYSEEEPEERTGLNGIGKSTIVRLVDYALAGNDGKRYFDTKKYSFLMDHQFSIEVSVNNKVFTITRYFGNENTYIGENNQLPGEFSKEQAKSLFNSLFFEKDEFNGYIGLNWFRPLIKFFVKDDLNSNKRWEPLKFNSPYDPDPLCFSYNFFLLGIPIGHIYEYYLNSKNKKELMKVKNKISDSIFAETGKKVGEFKSEKVEIEKRIGTIQENIREYEFLENYKLVESKLKDISGTISGELRKLNILDKKLENCRRSHKIELEIDIRKVEKLYREINTQIGDFVKRSLEDVMNFRKEIADNRKRFLSERERELTKEINSIYGKIAQLESERSKLYKMLDEKQALSSLKNAYERMIEEKTKLERNEANVSKIDELEKTIAGKQIEIEENIMQIINDVNNEAEDIVKRLSELFGDIVSNAIFVNESSEDKSFYIRGEAPKKRNESPIKFTLNIPKSDAFGNSRFKILAYDLMVFLNIVMNDRELPRFLIHDGVFHGISRETVVNVLNYMFSKSLQYQNMQYIITANREELFYPELPEGSGYSFNLNDMIVAEYEDIAEKMIFGRVF